MLPWVRRLDPIVIQPYDPSWAESFAAERKLLTRVLRPWLVRPIEHIGSTAVPGLAAKPIIDMLAVVDDIDAVDVTDDDLQEIGWARTPEPNDAVQRRLSWCKPTPLRRSRHLHIVEAHSQRWRTWLAFRDHLRSDPVAAAEYAQLKRQLAARLGPNPDDREAYRRAKEPFIARIVHTRQATWSRLDAPWRVAFEQAWEAFVAGSVPVGAAVTGPDGDVVVAGRSRSYETQAPRDQIAGTYLAHAEINALIQLPRSDYWDHVLYTTLEPCLLCSAALTHSHIGVVRYAALDPLWTGLERLPELNPHVERRWPRREHALDGPLSAWASLLPLIFYLRRESERVHHSYQAHHPRLLTLARELIHTAAFARQPAPSLLDVLEPLWNRLNAVSGRQP